MVRVIVMFRTVQFKYGPNITLIWGVIQVLGVNSAIQKSIMTIVKIVKFFGYNLFQVDHVKNVTIDFVLNLRNHEEDQIWQEITNSRNPGYLSKTATNINSRTWTNPIVHGAELVCQLQQISVMKC